MKLLWVAGLCAGLVLFAQTPDAAEQQALSNALAETQGSPVDFLRALERHLERFPMSKQRPDIERALLKSAFEAKDQARIVKYGESVLAREPEDIQVLDRVTRALFERDEAGSAQRLLGYAKTYGRLVGELRKQPAPSKFSPAQWRTELDRGESWALLAQARATGLLGKAGEAAELARRSYEALPGAGPAREWGRWLAVAGKIEDAVRRYAAAFAAPDATESSRSADRRRMGELYRKLKGSEAGLGDLVLEAYDAAAALASGRRDAARKLDPNAGAAAAFDFTLSGLSRPALPLSSLRGKVAVLDFWATWCGPCRAQHGLYEQVKERFQGRDDVVFVSINTDEDRAAVPAFLKEQGWTQPVYFEDGLQGFLKVSSIPTTFVIDKKGEIVSRMNGYVPEKFVDMLSDRIKDALR